MADQVQRFNVGSNTDHPGFSEMYPAEEGHWISYSDYEKALDAAEEVAGYTLICWELECGHKVSPPSDIIGPRYPSRMRCRRCFEEAESSG